MRITTTLTRDECTTGNKVAYRIQS
jgi:hypothetical protein